MAKKFGGTPGSKPVGTVLYAKPTGSENRAKVAEAMDAFLADPGNRYYYSNLTPNEKTQFNRGITWNSYTGKYDTNFTLPAGSPKTQEQINWLTQNLNNPEFKTSWEGFSAGRKDQLLTDPKAQIVFTADPNTGETNIVAGAASTGSGKLGEAATPIKTGLGTVSAGLGTTFEAGAKGGSSVLEGVTTLSGKITDAVKDPAGTFGAATGQIVKTVPQAIQHGIDTGIAAAEEGKDTLVAGFDALLPDVKNPFAGLGGGSEQTGPPEDVPVGEPVGGAATSPGEKDTILEFTRRAQRGRLARKKGRQSSILTSAQGVRDRSNILKAGITSG